MSRIWDKKISPIITARCSASMHNDGCGFRIERIVLISGTENIRVELALSEEDIQGLLIMVKEAKKGIVKFE